MDDSPTAADVAFGLLAAGSRLEQKLDRSLSGIKGITFSEYRLLDALRSAPNSMSTRVDLARTLALSPSGVTRALKPLEKMGIVETVRDERDARRSLATLTPAGVDLLDDAAGVVHDSIEAMEGLSTLDAGQKQMVLAAVRGIPHG